MKTIWKFVLNPVCEVRMPIGAELLSVHGQRNGVCLWALVDDSKNTETRKFYVFGTGHKIPDIPLRFVGTALIFGEEYVFHVFEGV